MSENILGIDTSNYTTSAALWHDGEISNFKQPLAVESGQRGLRQSDAVFKHLKQIDKVLEPILTSRKSFAAIGVSDRPREQEDSYMPCFLVGFEFARTIARISGVETDCFSHQQGHIAAALFSAGSLELLGSDFLAFHISGGTTELLSVSPDSEGLPRAKILAGSLDLKAGQAIDRVGVMLGLKFPCGPELEKLAAECTDNICTKPSIKGKDISLSGIENKCLKLKEQGYPQSYIAKFCIISILSALEGMYLAVNKERPGLPLLFSGGVASNSTIREYFMNHYGAVFATPEFSSDNGAGVAVLSGIRRKII